MDRSLTKGRAQRATKGSGGPSRGLVTVLEPAGAASEAYRTLGANLLHGPVDKPPKVVVVTSLGLVEGKSATCANLGVVLAQADQSTLIMDCNLHEPTMAGFFGLPNFFGVANVLTGERDLPQVWQEQLPGLKVATAGPLPPKPPAELLGSGRFAELVGRVRQEFDYVLIDSPPMGQVSDPLLLATRGDGVLLVLEAKKTRKRPLLESQRSLEAVGANILGTVVTHLKDGQSR